MDPESPTVGKREDRSEGRSESPTEDGDLTAPETEATGTEEVKKGSWMERIPVVGFVWSFYRGFSRSNGFLLSAGIAYYGLFSVGPLVILTLDIVGSIVGEATARAELQEALTAYLGEDLARVLSNVFVQSDVAGSTAFTVVGAVLLLWGATRLFARLQVSLNVMWGVLLRPAKTSWKRILSRAFTFGLILAPGILLIASFVLSAGFSWLTEVFGGGWLVHALEVLVPFLVSWATLLVIFTILPDVRISWRDSWLGALLTAVAGALGTRLFGFYIAWSGDQKYYGAAGALMALVVWVDFMAIVALLGSKLNRLLYERRGKSIEPYPYAARIPEVVHGETPPVRGTGEGL